MPGKRGKSTRHERMTLTSESMQSGGNLRIAQPNRWSRFAAIAALALCSLVVFLFSRGLPPFGELRATASSIVILYGACGLGWAIVLQGGIDLVKCLTGIAATALAGAVVASRSTSVPIWLVGLVAATTLVALVLNARLIQHDVQTRTGSFSNRLWSSLLARIPISVRTIAAKETELWIAVFHPTILNRKYSGLAQFTIGRRGSDATAMMVLIGIGLVELFVMHLALRAFFPTLAIIFTSATAIALVYLFGIARSLSAVPTTLSGDTLTIRLGALRQQTIPLAQIAEVSPLMGGQGSLGDTITLAIFDPPNVRLQLREPLPGPALFGAPRLCCWVDFRTDEPEELIRTLNMALSESQGPQLGQG